MVASTPPALHEPIFRITAGNKIAIAIDKMTADVKPFVELARALFLRRRQVAVILQKWQHVKIVEESLSLYGAGEALASGCISLCCLAITDEAFQIIKPSAILYSFPSRVKMQEYEAKLKLPTVLVGSEDADVDLSYPPRPSVRVRNSSDATIAAQVIDDFAAQYSDTGLWQQLKELHC
eukprot:TRINITY_DN20461_c0_g1_i1.p1 TRINITY_DN20461_c0_g1~~TRINITY_DN20461_c0_g1_i1.p1  ORF type:complete len:207 (+),score=50.51 TRINITY_DN20461_c0_g1_i1:86-622(+)